MYNYRINYTERAEGLWRQRLRVKFGGEVRQKENSPSVKISRAGKQLKRKVGRTLSQTGKKTRRVLKSAERVFENEFVEADSFDEIVFRKAQNVILRVIKKVSFDYDGRRRVEFDAYIVNVIVKFGIIHFSVALVNALFHDFVIFHYFRPNFEHFSPPSIYKYIVT